MKDFEDWFKENSFSLLPKCKDLEDFCREVWQAAQQPQWIKPTDRLPEGEEDHIDCLVIKNGNVLIRPFNTYFHCWDNEDYDDCFCDALDVEWWMPRPAPPAEK